MRELAPGSQWGLGRFVGREPCSVSEWKKHCTYWFRRRVPAALLCPFSAGAETVSRQAGGRTAVGGAGEFPFHPDRRRTNRELEGRADLVGKKLQRRR